MRCPPSSGAVNLVPVDAPSASPPGAEGLVFVWKVGGGAVVYLGGAVAPPGAVFDEPARQRDAAVWAAIVRSLVTT
eukprot:283343-Chlamydomonas_euryale.AAC.1